MAGGRKYVIQHLKAKFEKQTKKHYKCIDKVEKRILDKCMKIISIHSLGCIQCIQNIKDLSILKARKWSVSESFAMKASWRKSVNK